MNRKTVSGIMLTLLLLGMFILAFNIQSIKAEPRTWTVDDDRVECPDADFTSIQQAINAAGSGDTIYVYNGTYYERVKIDKHLNLVGADKGTTIIDANGANEAIYVHSDAKKVVISGFTIKKSLQGILLLNDFSTVSGNIVTNNLNGIVMRSSNGHIISDNKIVSNGQDGIYMRGSHDNKFYNNIIDNNGRCGIWSGSSFNNVFAVNILSNNRYGIWSGSSFKNNIFYHNNFIENTKQVRMYEPQYANIWDDGYPSGGNYLSDYTTRYPSVGDEYHGENQDILGSDGIWDSPYVIDVNNQDNYPLVKPWPIIPVSVDLSPDTLNLRSEGTWITAYIQLPVGYNPEDTDATTILLNETIQPVLDPKYGFVTNSSEYLIDHNEDGILERMVRFDKAEVMALLSVGEATLTITGEVNSTPFEGTDTIRVRGK